MPIKLKCPLCDNASSFYTIARTEYDEDENKIAYYPDEVGQYQCSDCDSYIIVSRLAGEKPNDTK